MAIDGGGPATTGIEDAGRMFDEGVDFEEERSAVSLAMASSISVATRRCSGTCLDPRCPGLVTPVWPNVVPYIGRGLSVPDLERELSPDARRKLCAAVLPTPAPERLSLRPLELLLVLPV